MLTRARSVAAARLRRSRQRGVVAVVVAMTIVGLIGTVGMAIDLGQLFVAKTELQNAADACALAATRELRTGNTKPTERAIAAGRTVANLHRVGFQGVAIGGTNTPVTIRFAATAAGPFTETGVGLNATLADTMKYVRCEIPQTAIKTYFIQVLNLIPGVTIGDQSVTSSAVATLIPSHTACAIPIAMCTSDAVPANIGKWYPGPLQPVREEGISPGSFGWVDLTPRSKGSGTADIGAQLISDGVCDLPDIGTTIGVSGNRASLASYFNSRFGIYSGTVKLTDANPDRSGYAYTSLTWPNPNSANPSNAFPDFPARQAANAAYQGDGVTGLTTASSGQPSSYLRDNGKERRVVVVPTVDCKGKGVAQNAPLAGWGCVFLLHPMNANIPDTSKKSNPSVSQCFEGANSSKVCVEYRGAANADGSPCVSSGMPGSPYSIGARVPALVK